MSQTAHDCNKTENISEHIGLVLFKLGTSGVHRILRHKVTTIKMLPCQHSHFQFLFALNKISDFEQISRG